MRKLLLLLCSLLLLGGSSPDEALSLDVEVKGLPRGKAGEAIELKVKLKNTSQEPVQVVLPGDGSESGWREPHVYYSVEKREGQDWKELAPHGIARCGLYDSIWQDDVRTLAPGASVDAGGWLPGPQASFQLAPGTYRFRLHYDYAAGKNSKGPATEPPEALRAVPAFHLVSNCVEYTILP